MNAIIVYDIYKTTREHKAPDTTIGLALYKDEHPEVTISKQEDKAIREFMGQHGEALAKAFPDPVAFFKAVEDGVAKDAKKAAEAV
ncbi:MAG: hypothetical protein VB071_14705 [Lawsonibacter sp.]|nr:hypothetical protein [Lawsonibacter sp.]